MLAVTTTRENKGKSVLITMNDYTALDLETTGLDPSCDCIIEIGAVRIRDGVIVDHFQSLVYPGFEIDGFISELTGITNEMLKEAPSLEAVLPQAIDFIGEDIVIAHNANFDVNFMYDSCSNLTLSSFSNNFVDTMRMSRRLFPQHSHHRLKDLVERYNISTSAAHRALQDAETAHSCYEYMNRYIQENSIDFNTRSYGHASFKASDICTDKTQFDEISPLFGKMVVFTGTLEKMGRKEAMQKVVDLGGLCGDTVTKKTNFLVLGNNDYCSIIRDGKSNKQKKAEQLKLSGGDIEILSENVFYDIVSMQYGIAPY